MVDINDFNSVFHVKKGQGYEHAVYDEISSNRHRLGGKLLFDRLLDLLQIKLGNLYPPKTHTDLVNLHKRILSAHTDLHNKECLLFYILKDLAPSQHTETDIATAFSAAVHLPKQFETFLEGLWALDRMQYQTAVGYLTHPSLIPTFPDEILERLLKHEMESWGLGEGEDGGLSLAYWQAVRPPLGREDVRDLFVKYLADRDVTETFFWIRARPEEEQRQMFEILIESAVGKFSGQKRADRGMELVGLPFSETEEEWFENYLSEGQGRNLAAARDTLMVRRIAIGKVKDAVREGGVKGRKHNDVNWEVVKNGIEMGLGPRMDEDTPFVV